MAAPPSTASVASIMSRARSEFFFHQTSRRKRASVPNVSQSSGWNQPALRTFSATSCVWMSMRRSPGALRADVLDER